MQLTTNRAFLFPVTSPELSQLWVITQRLLFRYVDLFVLPTGANAEDAILLSPAEDAPSMFASWGEGITRCGALDGQEDLLSFANTLTEIVQVVLNSLEADEDFLTAMVACLDQVFGRDLVEIATTDGSVTYEVLYRALRGDDEYAVLAPTQDEEESIMILRCVYPEEGDTPMFDDADEEIGDSVYEEFMQVFAEELADNEEE